MNEMPTKMPVSIQYRYFTGGTSENTLLCLPCTLTLCVQDRGLHVALFEECLYVDNAWCP